MASAVRLHLDDHSKFGSGTRHFVAIQGRKWVRLVELATGESGRITVDEFLGAVRGFDDRKTHKELLDHKRVARRLRRNAKTYGNDKSTAVKEALEALKA